MKAERGGEEVMETAHWYASMLHTYTYLHLVPSLVQKHHFRVSPPNVLNIHIRAGRGWVKKNCKMLCLRAHHTPLTRHDTTAITNLTHNTFYVGHIQLLTSC